MKGFSRLVLSPADQHRITRTGQIRKEHVMSAKVIRLSRNAAIATGILAGLGFMVFSSQAQVATNPPNTGMADPAMLISAFDRFASAGPGATLVIPLISMRG